MFENDVNKQLKINNLLSKNSNVNNVNNSNRYNNSIQSGCTVYSEVFVNSNQIQKAYDNKNNLIKSTDYLNESSFNNSISEKNGSKIGRSQFFESCVETFNEIEENELEDTKNNISKENNVEIINDTNFSAQLTSILKNHKDFNSSIISNINIEKKSQYSYNISRNSIEEMKKIKYVDKKLNNSVEINIYNNRNPFFSSNEELNNLRKIIKTSDNNSNINYDFESVYNNSIYLNDVEFKDIDEKEINLEFLKSNIRTIPIKYRKNIRQSEKYLKTVLELQNFSIKNRKCNINIAKLSENCKYFSLGCEDGIIIIYKIIGHEYGNYKKSYEKNEIISFLSFIEEEPYKELIGHQKDITDLNWSPFNDYYLLSSSLDHSVILWNINNKNMLLKKFNHTDKEASVCFSPTNKDIFVSGCMNGLITIWENIYARKIK